MKCPNNFLFLKVGICVLYEVSFLYLLSVNLLSDVLKIFSPHGLYFHFFNILQSTAVYSFDEFQFIIIFFWNCFLCLVRNIYLISTKEDFLPCFFFSRSLKIFAFTWSFYVNLCVFVYVWGNGQGSWLFKWMFEYSSTICWRLPLTSLNFLCCKSLGRTVCRSILELYFFSIQLYIWSYINTVLPQLIYFTLGSS